MPIDVEDDAAKLNAYVEKWKPPYQMLVDLDASSKNAVTTFLAEAFNTQNLALPSSVITDREGHVLEVIRGIPTVSQVRKWRAKRSADL